MIKKYGNAGIQIQESFKTFKQKQNHPYSETIRNIEELSNYLIGARNLGSVGIRNDHELIIRNNIVPNIQPVFRISNSSPIILRTLIIELREEETIGIRDKNELISYRDSDYPD